MSKKKKRKRTPEGKKISKLMHEGVLQKQAIAESLSMKRAGRLTPEGGYRRVGKKRSRRRSHKS